MHWIETGGRGNAVSKAWSPGNGSQPDFQSRVISINCILFIWEGGGGAGDGSTQPVTMNVSLWGLWRSNVKRCPEYWSGVIEQHWECPVKAGHEWTMGVVLIRVRPASNLLVRGWPRATVPLAAKPLKTRPCPYMVITECSALPFVWCGMPGKGATQWLFNVIATMT